MYVNMEIYFSCIFSSQETNLIHNFFSQKIQRRVLQVDKINCMQLNVNEATCVNMHVPVIYNPYQFRVKTQGSKWLTEHVSFL